MPRIVHRTINKFASPPQELDASGFLIRKVIGSQIESCDPFLMLDHIGPVSFQPGEAVGAPDHPHRGFETVTYVVEGGVKHEDSLGHKGELRSGWVQWMTAGEGIVHSEMPTDDLVCYGGQWEGFQLWVNLPSRDKMMPPRYQDRSPEAIPTVSTPDGKVCVKVISGESLGAKASIETRTAILMLDIHLAPGASFTQEVSPSYNGFAYVWRGSGCLGGDLQPTKMGQVGLLSDEGTLLYMKADDDQGCNILLVAGEPINEPVVKYGPFVMNTQAEIEQALEDYRNGKLGKIVRPGDSDDYAADLTFQAAGLSLNGANQ